MNRGDRKVRSALWQPSSRGGWPSGLRPCQSLQLQIVEPGSGACSGREPMSASVPLRALAAYSDAQLFRLSRFNNDDTSHAIRVHNSA